MCVATFDAVFTVKRCFQFPLFFLSTPRHTNQKPASALLLSLFHQPSPIVSLSHESRLSKRSFCISGLCWLVCFAVWSSCACTQRLCPKFLRSSFSETQQQGWMFRFMVTLSGTEHSRIWRVKVDGGLEAFTGCLKGGGRRRRFRGGHWECFSASWSLDSTTHLCSSSCSVFSHSSDI